MNSIKTASVCGLGKLGACIAATLAVRGFEVVGVDIDQEKVKKINEGFAPLDEPLLAETIRAGHSRLRATLNPRETVATDATFFIPPSPESTRRKFFQRVLVEGHQRGTDEDFAEQLHHHEDQFYQSVAADGAAVACATYNSALEQIKALARKSRATAVCPSNTHIIGEARHNPEFARVLTPLSTWCCRTGCPWFGRSTFVEPVRTGVYGPYFMRHASRNTPRPWRHFFFGEVRHG